VGFYDALKNERAEVQLLLDATTRCTQAGFDAKAEALLDWLYQIQADEGDPELKVLVFTEFVPTQEMLQQFLTERGFSVVCLNGSMDMDERKKVQDAFAEDARILVSTDAGGEGLNLQFCHVVINYDLPWNPMRIEQRIGRVDRIGQTHVVRAVNFVFEDSVEHRVREVLEEKLVVIFEEFGIDKTGDVLDSAQAGQIFNDLYVETILNPDDIDVSVDKAITRMQEEVRDTQASSSVLGATEELEPSEAQRLMAHPLPYWVERMTVSYLKSHGGKAERMRRTWNLTWPDGEELKRIVFTGKEAAQIPTAYHLTLEDSRIRDLAMRLPHFVPGQPISVVMIPGIGEGISGLWSLWHVGFTTMEWNRHRIMPLFLDDNGRVFAPTARHLWDHFLSAPPDIIRHLDLDESNEALARLGEIAAEHGKIIYDVLVEENRARLRREKEKNQYAFASRRRVIERIGLPQVREHRLTLLQQEELASSKDIERKAMGLPEMEPLLVVRVNGGARE